jgi:hypothetical protein
MDIARPTLVICLMLAGCAGETHSPAGRVAATPAPPRTAASSPLAGTRWQLVQFQSPEDSIGIEKPANPEHYVMELQDGGGLSLQLDCNRATGHWAAHPASPTDGSISLDAPAMTSAACLPGSWDTRLARDLAFVRGYVLEGDRLHLALKIDSGIYTWRRMSP